MAQFSHTTTELFHTIRFKRRGLPSLGGRGMRPPPFVLRLYS
jgi:hypothetical protein